MGRLMAKNDEESEKGEKNVIEVKEENEKEIDRKGEKIEKIEKTEKIVTKDTENLELQLLEEYAMTEKIKLINESEPFSSGNHLI